MTVAVPLEEMPEIEVRLAAIWRDKTIVSQTVYQTIPGIPVRPKTPQLLTNMQISPKQFLICWQSDPPLGHLTVDGNSYNVELKNEELKTETDSFETSSQCHLFETSGATETAGMPTKYKVYVWEKHEGEVGEDGMSEVTVIEAKDKLQVNVTLEKIQG